MPSFSQNTSFLIAGTCFLAAVGLTLYYPAKLAEMKAENHLARMQAEKTDDDDTPIDPDVSARAFPEICTRAFWTNSARASLDYGALLLRYGKETGEWGVVRPLQEEIMDLGIRRDLSEEECDAICTKLQPVLAPFSEEEL